MSESPAKDFGPIADDYVFFETHATEAEEDARAYVRELAGITTTGPIRLLDFGCGSGTFSAQFLELAGWPPERLQLTLVEPVESARQQALTRLARFTTSPMAASATLPTDRSACFDVVLSNHVLYYASDLRGHLSRLIDAIAPAGLFMTAIAGRTNAMFEIWAKGFSLIGREIPYNTSEDVEATLVSLGANYQKEQVAYELIFPDTEENRMKILRFLLADHLKQMPHAPLLEVFDQHAHAGRIEMRTGSEHFRVRSPHS